MPCSVQARLDYPAYVCPKNMFMNNRMILQYILDEIGAMVDLNQGMGRVIGYPETGGKGSLLPIVDSVKGGDYTNFCHY